MLHTRLCDFLGIEFPIICAPMGFVTGPELAAAVSNAGGLGIMPFSGNPPASASSRNSPSKKPHRQAIWCEPASTLSCG